MLYDLCLSGISIPACASEVAAAGACRSFASGRCHSLTRLLGGIGGDITHPAGRGPTQGRLREEPTADDFLTTKDRKTEEAGERGEAARGALAACTGRWSLGGKRRGGRGLRRKKGRVECGQQRGERKRSNLVCLTVCWRIEINCLSICRGKKTNERRLRLRS